MADLSRNCPQALTGAGQLAAPQQRRRTIAAVDARIVPDSWPRRLIVAAVAVASLTLTHGTVYGLFGPHHHPGPIMGTGDGVWPLAPELAAAVLLGSAAALVFGPTRRGPLPARTLTGRLAALQTGGFLTLELVESALYHPPHLVPVVAGAALQPVTAALLAWLVSSARTIVTTQRAPRPLPAVRTPRYVAAGRARSWVPTAAPGRGRAALRGPPVSSCGLR